MAALSGDLEVAQGMSAALTLLGEAGAITPVSLDLHETISFERYEALGAMFGALKRWSSWWIGDLINFGEATFGEKYAQVEHATGLSPDTLRNYASVCKRVPKARRRQNVPFSCHEVVAAMPPREQRRWLAVAERRGLTQRELREFIRAAGERDTPSLSEGASGGGVSPAARLQEVAVGIFNNAVRDPRERDWHRVPSEWIAQLGAALGKEQ